VCLSGCNAKQAPLRLHVVANSNSTEDQEVKLKVRDELLGFSGQAMEEATSREAAEDYVLSHMAEIDRNAEDALKQNGFDYGATVSVGEFYFPEKTYGDTVYPAGNYQAVKIVLGAGQGDNWWCVIFPPLCLIAVQDEEEGGIQDGEDGFVPEKIKYKSIFAEWFGK
jgi:stage II sporulation protein R